MRIIVLFVAVLPRLRIGGRQALFRNEAAGPELGMAETIRESAHRFVVLYVAITAAATLALAALGWTEIDPRMDLFRAVGHAFATVATAGSSTEARSIEPFAPATQWVLIVFMVLAGTNFALLSVAVVRRRVRAFARDEEFRVYIVVLALAGSLAGKRVAPPGAGSFRTDSPTFAVVLVAVVVLVALLTFIPALLLGPAVQGLTDQLF